LNSIPGGQHGVHRSNPGFYHSKESACGCVGIYTTHAAAELYAEAFDSVGKLELLEDFVGLERSIMGWRGIVEGLRW